MVKPRRGCQCGFFPLGSAIVACICQENSFKGHPIFAARHLNSLSDVEASLQGQPTLALLSDCLSSILQATTVVGQRPPTTVIAGRPRDSNPYYSFRFLQQQQQVWPVSRLCPAPAPHTGVKQQPHVLHASMLCCTANPRHALRACGDDAQLDTLLCHHSL